MSSSPRLQSARRPRGYLGADHVTIGSDILAVLAVLKFPDHLLGAAEANKLRGVSPNEWYPIAWLLDLMEAIDQHVGHHGLLQMGRALFKLSHEQRVLKVARSARDILYGIDGMYRVANRGDRIGGWQVLVFQPGRAELDKTTPHHCVMEQGLLTGALNAVGCHGLVSQQQCFRQGADSCVYTVTASPGPYWDHTVKGSASS
jgi:hypothetical protein